MEHERKRTRYRFGPFAISPSRRALLRDGVEIPLIPRYFELLLLLLERRDEVVERRTILDRVWSDVVVSDGALSQAIRTLRRALGDTSRTPTYIRTLPRYGYRFVFDAVVEEDDAAALPFEHRSTGAPSAEDAANDRFEAAIERLLGGDPGRGDEEADDRREAAETLHGLGTAEALRRIDRRPGHEAARALLRDVRWDLADAGPVPILGQPGVLRTGAHLIVMRIRRVVSLAGGRWGGSVAGGALAGIVAALIGSVLLRFGPGATATNRVFVAMPLVGLVIGGLGAAGVGAGLAAAEALFRSARSIALVLGGAAGGGIIGSLAHAVGLWALAGLFGRDLSPLAGGFEGTALGAATGLGYALATRGTEGMASPAARGRVRAAVVSGTVCALAGIGLAWSGSYLGAMSLDFMAHGFPGSEVGLEPLARLLGEAAAGRRTSLVISAWEGFMFAFGLVFGLTRRPR